MSPEIEFRGDFEANAKITFSPGHWYLGFACEACGEPFAILDDPTDTGTVQPMGSARVRLACPHCGERRAYPAERMQTFRAATASALTPI